MSADPDFAILYIGWLSMSVFGLSLTAGQAVILNSKVSTLYNYSNLIAIYTPEFTNSGIFSFVRKGKRGNRKNKNGERRTTRGEIEEKGDL